MPHPDFSIVPPGATKEEAAKLLYPGLTFDTALPQDWVDAARNSGFDVRPHFVWGYPKGSIFGRATPLTQEGWDWFCDLLDRNGAPIRPF